MNVVFEAAAAKNASAKRSALVTGGAGFIGSHLVDMLLADGWEVTVVDNLDPYYDPAQKRANIASHFDYETYRFVEGDIRDAEALEVLTGDYEVIVHLAAKAGVRPSCEDPVVYQHVNVGGTQHLLECAREWGVKQFVFGSSSSVYGINPNVPWRESDAVLQPISPYASTKVSGELLGHVYSHLYGIRFIALRLFTVYGPRQRPDLAIHKFARLLAEGKPVPVFGDGTTRRDYTYVGDIVQGIRAAMQYEGSTYETINLASGRPIPLKALIEALAETLDLPVAMDFQEEQPGDVPQTWASIDRAQALLDYRPRMDLKEGLEAFKDWLSMQSVVS